MQFCIIAKDYTDSEALDRRLKARAAHIALGDKMKAEGKAIFGTALLNEKKEMKGSVYILNFPSKEALNKYLEEEPYITEKVWEHIEIQECKVGPSFIQ